MVQLLVMSIRSISQFLNLVLQEILVTAPELQEDGLGTRGNFNFSHVYLLIHTSIWCHKGDPGHGTKNCKRMGLGTEYYQCKFISITCLSTGAPRDVMAPELQEVSLYQFYMNLNVHSGFLVYFSLCCVLL